MQQILNLLLGWIPQATVVLSFFNPDRCKAIFDMIIRTIDYSKELMDVDQEGELYEKTLKYACDLYDEWDEAEKYVPAVDSFVKGTLFPVALGFVFGGNN